MGMRRSVPVIERRGQFGVALYRAVALAPTAVLFFAIVAPIGILMRAFGSDRLLLRRDPKAASYWIIREPPGPTPEAMKRQY